MKSSEFYRILKRNGWKHICSDGSHYIYEKDGRTYPVPFHGAKRWEKAFAKKSLKI